MRKYLIGLLAALPALLLAFIFIAVPMLINLFTSFQQYDMIISRGWVGLDNYFQALFYPGTLLRLIPQTLALQFFAGLGAAAVGSVLAFALSRLSNPAPRWALAAVLAAVSFFPVGGVSLFRTPGGLSYSLYASPVLAVFLHILFAMARGIGPALLLGLAGAVFAAGRGGSAFGGAAAGGGVWFLFHLALSLQNSFSLPYQLGGSLANWNGSPALLAYQIGFQRLEFSVAAAIWVITYFVTLAFLVPAAIVLRYLLFRRTGDADVQPAPAKSSSFVLPAAGLILLGAGAAGMLYYGRHSVLSTGISYVFLYLVAALLCGGLALLLAAPLNSASAPIRVITAIAYLFLAAVPMCSVGNYELFRTIKLINTAASVVLSGLFCFPAVLVMGLYLNRSRGHGLSPGDYLSAAVRPAACVAAFQFLMLWGDNLASELIYIGSARQFSPNLALIHTAVAADPGAFSFPLYLLAAILVSAGVLLAAGACLRERKPAEPLDSAPSDPSSVK